MGRRVRGRLCFAGEREERGGQGCTARAEGGMASSGRKRGRRHPGRGSVQGGRCAELCSCSAWEERRRREKKERGGGRKRKEKKKRERERAGGAIRGGGQPRERCDIRPVDDTHAEREKGEHNDGD